MAFFLLFLSLTIQDIHGEVPQDLNYSKMIEFPVEKFKLDNGLTVLIHEDHSVPILSYHQWFRVGSKDEKPGRTGLAHFFEHLMFKGTTEYAAGEMERVIQSNGGDFNAFTSLDYTGYYINLPNDKLEVAMQIESSRMTNLLFDQKQINSEREVVKEERRFRVDNQIMGFLNQKVFSTVFKVHSYRWPVIGYMRDLNAATKNDMKDFYRVHYAPNNSVLVIAGAVNSADVKKLVQKYYGKIKPQKLPEKKFKQEPEQKAARGVNIKRSVQAPVFALVYKAPKAGVPDAYTLDLLSNILSDGHSSRLYKRLVYRGQLASSISSYNYTPQEPGIFQVTGSLRPGANLQKAITATYSEIYKMRKKLVSEKELAKAKNQVMYSYVSSLKTVGGKARALAVNEILFGDYTRLFSDLEKYHEVSREDIKSAAERYLIPEKRSTITIVPQQGEGA